MQDVFRTGIKKCENSGPAGRRGKAARQAGTNEQGEKKAQISARPEIGPEIIKKLAAGNGAIWTAAHDDGSGNS